MTDETQEKNIEPTAREKQQTTIKWYSQTAVWAVIISIVALIFSQLPPVTTWVPKDNLKTEISEKIALPLTIGIPGYQIFLDLKNIGNRSLAITNFELEITYPDQSVRILKAESYVRNLPDQPVPIVFPITSVSLNIDERWAETIMFNPMTNPSEDEEITRYRAQIAQSIFSKRQAAPAAQPYSLLKADDSIVANAIKFFGRKFDLRKGTYKASLMCRINGREDRLKTFEFTLYDYHIFTFESQPDDYKWDWGINYPVVPPKQVWVSLSK